MMPQVFCIDCEHIGTNHGKDETKYRCFAPQNKSGHDLVTGAEKFKFELCYDARGTGPLRCGPAGDWFTERKKAAGADAVIEDLDIEV